MILSKLFCNIPLAWLQLVKTKTRLAIAVAGIAFADILIFTQMGFEDMLFDSTMTPQRSLDADLVFLNPYFETVYSVKSFPKVHIYQALSVEEVQSVSPLYMGLGTWRNPQTFGTRTILIFGIDPEFQAFKDQKINQSLEQLKMLNNILFDQSSRPEFGPILSMFRQKPKLQVQLNDINVEVKGLFAMGASFAADGNVITSDSTFLHLFPNHQPDRVEAGLVKLKPNVDSKKVIQKLKLVLPNDVKIVTSEEFAELEKTYWEHATPVGFVFRLGVIVSFIVGNVIVYQILYSDVIDHLPEYATLKAMGYTDSYFLAVLAQQAMILAFLGYVPGFLLSIGIYKLTHIAILLPIGMTANRAFTVLVLTILMCFISGAIAMQKLKHADPAEIF